MDLSTRMLDQASVIAAVEGQLNASMLQQTGCNQNVSMLAASSLYKGIILFKGSFGIAGAFLNILHLLLRGTDWSGHRNTSICLFYFYASNVIIGAANAAINFTEYFRLTLAHCESLDFRLVLALRGLNVSAVITKALILLLTAFERLYASFRPVQYYNNPAPKRTHALCVILALCAAAYTIFLSSKYGQMLITLVKVPTLDLKTKHNALEYEMLVWTMAFLQCLNIIVCFFAGVVSRIVKGRVNRESGERIVNEKYQLLENIKVLNVLLPVAMIDAAVSLSGSILQLAGAPQRSSWTVLDSQLYLVSYTFAGYNIISLPAGVEILKMYKSLKKALSKAGNKVLPSQHHYHTALHFESLEKAWKYQSKSKVGDIEASQEAAVESPQQRTA